MRTPLPPAGRRGCGHGVQPERYEPRSGPRSGDRVRQLRERRGEALFLHPSVPRAGSTQGLRQKHGYRSLCGDVGERRRPDARAGVCDGVVEPRALRLVNPAGKYHRHRCWAGRARERECRVRSVDRPRCLLGDEYRDPRRACWTCWSGRPCRTRDRRCRSGSTSRTRCSCGAGSSGGAGCALNALCSPCASCSHGSCRAGCSRGSWRACHAGRSRSAGRPRSPSRLGPLSVGYWHS